MTEEARELGIQGISDAVEVGRGGFATVYRARQEAFHRELAVKVLNTRPDPDTLARFQREVRAMGSLGEHPSIVALYDAGTTAEGKLYMLMPYMSGGSYGDALGRGSRLSWREACEIGATLAGALQAAHDAGVLHRDVKPANILRDRYGNPMLADFGIARVAGGPETTTGVVTASIAHAPPEVLNGDKPTLRSDLYSLCSTLVALVTGHAPFESATDESVLPLITRVLTTPPPRVEDVPDSFNDVMAQGLAKDPADRFPDARALSAALSAAISAAASAGAGGPPDPPAPPAGSMSFPGHQEGATARVSGPPHNALDVEPTAEAGGHRRRVVAGAVLALLLVVLVVAGLVSSGGEDPGVVDGDPTPTVGAATAGGAAEPSTAGGADSPATGDGTVVVASPLSGPSGGPPIQDPTLDGMLDTELLRAAQAAPVDPGEPIDAGTTTVSLDPSQIVKRPLVVPAGSSLRIQTIGGALDVALALFTPEGLFVIADDDTGGGENGANAFIDLPDGRALVVAVINLDDEVAGEVDVELSFSRPRPLRIGANDAVLEDLAPVHAWTVQIGGGAPPVNTVAMTAGTFDPAMRLVDDRGRPRAIVSGGTRPRIDLTALEPGTYTVMAFSEGDPGEALGRYAVTLE